MTFSSVRCERRKQLAEEYRAAAAALSRTVGELNTNASAGAPELYQQSQGEFRRAKRTVESALVAMQDHESKHGCG